MLNGSTTDINTSERPPVTPNLSSPNQALQVLAMAQRTADEHVRSAHRHADKIRAEAMAAAEQIAREADAHVQEVRREAAAVLAEARASAEQAAQEARSRVDDARRNADRIVSEARVRAESIGINAEQNAEELRLQAQRRYDDIVGSLATRREALQQQIEALECFDREYRARLTAFMQGQLRALWVDQPQVSGEPDPQAGGEPGDPRPELTSEPQPPAQRNAEMPNPGGLALAQREAPDPAAEREDS